MLNETAFRNALQHGTFSFTPRPSPLPEDLRMAWGISLLVIACRYSRGKRLSFQKLQFLAHSIRIPEGRDEVRGLLAGTYSAADVSFRVEPSLNRAVAYAHALKLVTIEKGTTISLTQEGSEIADAIIEDPETLQVEKHFLREVTPRITENLMKRVWRLEDLL
ncbi:hypothetical protein [Rhodopseudomonas sp. BR0C11]|uniref:hypothetical protein n=1 Tax=Rhodopseudomonas sp. BR0C11 TaxID=2269370 RepID=UPI001FED48A8|nr:hypothetical protein [Rhodopseudomonas sp. BR0C11]